MKTSKTILQLTVLIILLTFVATITGIFWQGDGQSYEFTSLHGETVEIQGHAPGRAVAIGKIGSEVP